MAKLLRYTKKDLSGSTVQQNSPSPTIAPDLNLYQRISDLPLRLFIICLVDNDLSVLIISGTPDDDKLKEAWANIYDEFVNSMGDSENKMYLQLLKEITRLDNKLKIVELIVKVLSTPYRDESANDLIDLLNKICNTKFKFNDPSELQRCINRSRSFKIQLDLKLSQFKEMQKKMEAGGSHKPTKEYFLSLLITLSDHVKYEVTDKITVFDFCERMKRFKKYCEQLNTGIRGRR